MSVSDGLELVAQLRVERVHVEARVRERLRHLGVGANAGREVAQVDRRPRSRPSRRSNPRVREIAGSRSTPVAPARSSSRRARSAWPVNVVRHRDRRARRPWQRSTSTRSSPAAHVVERDRLGQAARRREPLHGVRVERDPRGDRARAVGAQRTSTRASTLQPGEQHAPTTSNNPQTRRTGVS